ncbi:MAG: hypothetical protein AABX31_01145 [Nanoarchaeota archaeon]
MSIDATVLEERRPVKNPEEAVLKGTKYINKREDLDNLQQGDAITVFQGNNYGKLMLEREKLTYTGRTGNILTFYESVPSLTRQVQLSESDKDITSRDGVVILYHPEGIYTF